jgi:PadR family transcriptional regulator AphA
MSSRTLTTTSYAILAVLALRPHSSYELAKQTGLSLHYFWPRAESNLYAEPKRLVEAGLAESREEWNGSRKRTVYSITSAGRDALREWVSTPSAGGPRLESEALLKVFFAEHGTKTDLLTQLREIQKSAREGVEHFGEVTKQYADGEGQYPHRFALSAIAARLLFEQQHLLERWAAWAVDVVESWDEPSPDDPAWGVETMQAAGNPFDAPVSGGS